jgi:hypothetical protein
MPNTSEPAPRISSSPGFPLPGQAAMIAFRLPPTTGTIAVESATTASLLSELMNQLPLATDDSVTSRECLPKATFVIGFQARDAPHSSIEFIADCNGVRVILNGKPSSALVGEPDFDGAVRNICRSITSCQQSLGLRVESGSTS